MIRELYNECQSGCNVSPMLLHSRISSLPLSSFLLFFFSSSIPLPLPLHLLSLFLSFCSSFFSFIVILMISRYYGGNTTACEICNGGEYSLFNYTTCSSCADGTFNPSQGNNNDNNNERKKKRGRE